jgi:autotransporter-associated beta strand protein
MRARTYIAVLAGLMAVSQGWATDYTWTASNANWNLAANWAPNSGYPQAADSATFTNGDTGTRTITLNGSQSVSNLVFHNRGRATYTLSGAGDTLSLGGALDYTNPGTMTLGAILGGAGVLNINAAGHSDVGDGAYVRLNNALGTFTGDINVRGGRLDFLSNAALGDGGNVITLGSPGAYGKFGPSASLANSRNLVLSGNGAFLAGPGGNGWTNTGVISGPGELIVGSDSDVFLNPATANTYSGGTRIWKTAYVGRYGWNYTAVVHTNQALGTGDVRVEGGNSLYMATNSNMGANAKMWLVSNLLDGPYPQYYVGQSFNVLIVNSDSLPDFTANSSGGIAIDAATGGGINSRIAYGAPLLGTGYMRIGSRQSLSLNASTLNPNPDRVFRFGGLIYGGVSVIPNPGPLQDYGGQKHSLEVAGSQIVIRGRNTFNGDITLECGAGAWGWSQSGAGNCPFGGTNGSVFLKSASQIKFGGNTLNAHLMVKSNLVFDGTGSVMLDGGDVPGYVAKFQVDNLVRVGNSTLYVTGQRGRLGINTTNEHLIVLNNPPVSSNGMVSAVYTTKDSYNFLDYQANGFILAAGAYHTAANDAAFAAASETSIVNVTGAVAAGTKTVYALRTTAALSGGPVTIASGGLINAAAVTHTASFVFPTEPIIYCRVGNSVINGTITSANGLTKSGETQLKLGGDNSGSLTGPITINEGYLRITLANQLGASGNSIVLNGGTLYAESLNGSLANPFTLGSNGGKVDGSGSTTLAGKITGQGLLAITHNNLHITNTNNDFSGGTLVAGTLRLEENGKLGSGPVRVTGNLITLIQSVTPDNLNSNQQLGIYGNGIWSIQVKGGTQRASMVEGNGTIKLSHADPAFGIPTTLAVGCNDASSEFAGPILDAAPLTKAYGHGQLLKLGTGTFTLSGYSTYSGLTRVEDGTLLVNGTIDNAATVTVVSVAGSVPVLGGKGVVKSAVRTAGGHIAPGASVGTLITGALTLDATSALDIDLNGSAAAQADLLKVNGTVSLGGAALNVVLGFAPSMGQTFTILDNDGTADAVGGTFASGSKVAGTYGGKTYLFTINYAGGDGNDIVLMSVPSGSIYSIR